MVDYTPTFGGSPVNPGQVSYALYTLTGNLQLEWPVGLQDTASVATFWNDLSAADPDRHVILPDATQVSVGTGIIFNNVGTNNVDIDTYGGASLTTLITSVAKYFVLIDNSTAVGTWRIVTFGAGTSGADAIALAGSGLLALSNTLNLNLPIVAIGANTTLTTGYRANLVLWTGGAGTLTLPLASAAGNGLPILFHNAGTGTVVIAAQGGDTVDGAATISLLQGESGLVDSFNSTNAWYSVGLGRSTAFSVTTLSKNIGGASSPVTLTTNEIAAQLQTFTDTPDITGNMIIEYGSTPNFYFIDNQVTGAFTVTHRGLGADPGIVVPNGTKVILVNVNGTMKLAASIASGTVTSIATGTGLTGGPITGSGTISLANTAVAPGTFGSSTKTPVITIDQQGRITSASETNTAPLPTGSVTAYAGGAAPAGWSLCDGGVLNRVTEAALFAVVGTTFGVGDGSTTFNKPDLRGRGVFGRDDMGGVAASRVTSAGSGINGTVIGAAGGAQNLTLVAGQIPAVSLFWSGGAQPLTSGGTSVFAVSPGAVNFGLDATGYAGSLSPTAVNKMPPAMIMNYIIKL